MARRSLDFFMCLDEFTALAWRAANDLKLSVIFLRLFPNYVLELAERPDEIVMSDGAPADTLFLSAMVPKMDLVDATRLDPNIWGWVVCEPPRKEDNILLLARVTARSDYYDTNINKTVDNPASVVLFRRVAPYFRKRLNRPMWIYWASHTGREKGSRLRRDIGYSAGAAAWARNGGDLRQRGVANVRFAVEEPTDS